MNALLLAVALAAVPPPSPRQLVVSGDARITFKPNQVMVNLAVVANGRDEAAVRKTVEARGRQVVEACQKAGVEPQNVVSGYAMVSPQYRGNEVVGGAFSVSPDGKVSSSFAQRDFTVTSLVTASFDIEPPQ